MSSLGLGPGESQMSNIRAKLHPPSPTIFKAEPRTKKSLGPRPGFFWILKLDQDHTYLWTSPLENVGIHSLIFLQSLVLHLYFTAKIIEIIEILMCMIVLSHLQYISHSSEAWNIFRRKFYHFTHFFLFFTSSRFAIRCKINMYQYS